MVKLVDTLSSGGSAARLVGSSPIMRTMNTKKNKVKPGVFNAQKEALRRRNRQVIYLNDSEMSAIRLYCDRFNISKKSALFRQAIMQKILSELDDSHPTLF